MKGYTIYCSTGCSCCAYENHRRGPFSSREIAEKAVAAYREIPLLASQYSRTGNYEISEHEAETLPDGRVIVGNVVFPSWRDDDIAGNDTVQVEL